MRRQFNRDLQSRWQDRVQIRRSKWQAGKNVSCHRYREVSQPLHTPGKNLVLSEPSSTLKSRQLDGPFRSKSKRHMSQSTQLK